MDSYLKLKDLIKKMREFRLYGEVRYTGEYVSCFCQFNQIAT